MTVKVGSWSSFPWFLAQRSQVSLNSSQFFFIFVACVQLVYTSQSVKINRKNYIFPKFPRKNKRRRFKKKKMSCQLTNIIADFFFVCFRSSSLWIYLRYKKQNNKLMFIFIHSQSLPSIFAHVSFLSLQHFQTRSTNFLSMEILKNE